MFNNNELYENKNFYPRIFLTEDLIEVNNEQEMIEAMFDETPEKRMIVDFIRTTKRGIIRGSVDTIDE